MAVTFGDENAKTGLLLNANNIKLHRQWFREAVKLLGINVLYRAPKAGTKEYTTYGELDSAYQDPILVGVLFHEHPDQRTLRKIGWASELQEGGSLIEVDYDLPDLQQGCLFIIPTGLDDGKARLFRVSKISTSSVYPASITCEIVPEYVSTFDQVSNFDYSNSSYTLINREEDIQTSFGLNSED